MSDPATIFAALEAHDLDGLAWALAGCANPNALKPAPPPGSPLHKAIEQLEDGAASRRSCSPVTSDPRAELVDSRARCRPGAES